MRFKNADKCCNGREEQETRRKQMQEHTETGMRGRLFVEKHGGEGNNGETYAASAVFANECC